MTTLKSTNPATGEEVAEYAIHTEEAVDRWLDSTTSVQSRWATSQFEERASVLRDAADELRRRSDELASLMTIEMGKPIAQARSEVEKCAWVCEYYADSAEQMLSDVPRDSDNAGAWTVYRPLGTVLAVMPWNFPLWQVFRFAAPTLMAGNAGVLKHASNVSGSALAIEEVFSAAGLEAGLFRTLLLPSDRIDSLIADERIAAVTLTGSEGAGRAVAESAGRNLKPSVLELGGSDPYVILEDADISSAAKTCAKSRLLNSGQSCIAAKRFIVVDEVFDEFSDAFLAELEAAVVGDPTDENVTVGPQAKPKLRDELHDQVVRTIDAGATLLFGGEVPDGDGAFYPVTALVDVEPGMAAFDEELFGPVAPLIRASSESHAIELANTTTFGLGGAVFTADEERGRRIAADEIQTGCCFVNGLVASDPRLPFGGINNSGYGRELSEMGIHAFVNPKTVVVA